LFPFLSPQHKAYPSAICVGPEGVGAKKPDVKFAFEYTTNGLASASEKAGFEDEIESCYFKSHANKVSAGYLFQLLGRVRGRQKGYGRLRRARGGDGDEDRASSFRKRVKLTLSFLSSFVSHRTSPSSTSPREPSSKLT